MAQYRYKAKNRKGKTVFGTMEAENEAEFYNYLDKQELYCISVTKKGREIAGNGTERRLKIKALSMFCRELSVLLSSGMNLLSALRLLYEREENDYVKQSYMQMIECIEKGDTFYEAIKKQGNAYPGLLKAMILAGEASGAMDTIMEKMALYYEKEASLKSKVSNAMIYPMILIIVTFGVVILLFTFVLPKFFDMFEGQEVPAITEFFMSISKFMTSNWHFVLLGILLLVCVFKGLKENNRTGRKIDEFTLKIPVIGKLLEKIIMGHFANAMSILYASGVTVVRALEISGETIENRYIAEKLVQVQEKVEKGVALSQALQSEKMFDQMFWSMIHIGEESGNLETMFFKLSEYLEQESETAVRKMLAILEPLVLIVIALVIGMVVASVLLPIYSMYQV